MLRKKIVAILLAVVMLCSTAALAVSAKNAVDAPENANDDAVKNRGPVSDSTLATWAGQLKDQEMWFMLNYLSKQSGWKSGYDIIAQSGWIYNPSQKRAYTYETPRSLAKRIELINNLDLRGVICWDAQGDEMKKWTMFNQMKSGLKDKGKEVIAYFGNWMVYGDPTDHTQGQWVQDLPWDQLTEVNYAFFGVSNGQIVDKRNMRAVPKYRLVTLDEWVDFGFEHSDNPGSADEPLPNPKPGVGGKYGQGQPDEYWCFDQLEEIGIYGASHPEVKIVMSVGGWTKSEMFHEMASSAANRKVFIDSCVEFLNDFPHFDGFDIDWEYPGFAREPEDDLDQGNPAGPEDRENFVALCRELRAALDKAFPREHKVLTVCTASDQNDKLPFLDAKGIEPYVDSMNMMTYDYTGSWEPTLNQYESPVYSEKEGSWSTNNSVQYLLDQGVSSSKINIGCPLYGAGFTNVEADANGNPKDLPNPIANGLRGGTMSMPKGFERVPPDVAYTFYDGSERTPTEVHNPVKATIASGANCISLSTDPKTGEITVKGLQNGTAVLNVTDDLDGFSTKVTVNVQGEMKPLSVISVGKTQSGSTYTFTCNTEGGVAPYTYYGYVVKDGKIWHKMLDSSNPSFSFTPSEKGTYTVVMYCRDTTRAMAKNSTTFTF